MPKKKQTALITITTNNGGIRRRTVVVGDKGVIKIPKEFAEIMSSASVCEKKKPKSK